MSNIPSSMSAVPTEEQEQYRFIQWLYANGFNSDDFWHTPNSTYTDSIKQKTKNKRQGVKAGIPDLFLIINNHLIAIEMKRTKGGTTSRYQKVWLNKLNRAGIPSYICKGADEAIELVEHIQTVGWASSNVEPVEKINKDESPF